MMVTFETPPYPKGHVSQMQDLNERENVETNPGGPMTRTSGRLE